MALGGWICLAIQGYHGLGRHMKTISKHDLQVYAHIGFFQSIISAIGALGFLKISIGLFLLRLSKNKWYSRSLWALIGRPRLPTVHIRFARALKVELTQVTGFIVIYTIGAWLTFLLRCRPMSGMWDKTIKSECYPVSLFVAVALANSSKLPHVTMLGDCLPIFQVSTFSLMSASRPCRSRSFGHYKCLSAPVYISSAYSV
jgi:hypothetical protein